MRVAYNATTLAAPYGGVSVAVEAAARALARELGPELVMFVPSNYAEPEHRRDAGATGEPTLVRAPVTGRNRAARIAWEQLFLPAAALAHGAEVLHAPAYVLPLRWRGPAVVTVYDLLTLTHPEWCRRGNVAHFRRALPATLRRAERIVVPSEATAEEIRQHTDADPARLRRIPLGVEERFRPASPDAIAGTRRQWDLPERYVLIVGNLEPKKNVAGMARMFGRLVEEIPHQLVIAGREAWGDPRAWRVAVEDLPPGRVNLLGYVPRMDLPDLYSGAELLLHLSWHEGFGLPPLEAMACGTAAAVSNRGALPEIAGPGALVLDPEDEAGAARAIGEVLTNETARRELAARGQTHVAQYTWAAHARGLLQVYQEALDERAG